MLNETWFIKLILLSGDIFDYGSKYWSNRSQSRDIIAIILVQYLLLIKFIHNLRLILCCIKIYFNLQYASPTGVRKWIEKLVTIQSNYFSLKQLIDIINLVNIQWWGRFDQKISADLIDWIWHGNDQIDDIEYRSL